MFWKLFKKSGDNKESSKPEPIVVMILLENTNMLQSDELFKMFNEARSDEVLTNIQKNDDTYTFEIDGEMGFVSLMPGPMPWGDLEGPCATAWYWTKATEVLKQHKAHIIVSILPQNQQKQVLERIITTTKIVASVAKAANALGIYWGSGTVVQSKDNFINECMKMDKEYFPYELWIEFRIQVFPDRTCNIITTGMKAFGHMEIEVIRSSKDPMEVLEFIFNIIDYLIKNGPVIKDGDTVGEDESQRIKVYYKKSIWDRGGKVMFISY
ncbi:MAG: DUF4261 domain-containing protein [Bacillota bacterium]